MQKPDNSVLFNSMKERENRLNVLKNIILTKRIENQDTLLQKLKEEGYEVTQGTLSRDLKMLKVGKIPDKNGSYYYTISETESADDNMKNYFYDARKSIVSIDFNGNIGVIKTLSGNAQSVCYALDALCLPQLLGTIAGDDTIFFVLKQGVTKEEFFEEFNLK